MAGIPRSANPWRYHAGDTSAFWKKFREAVVVNPASTSGLPIPTENRWPHPGSRPEKYAEPASKASDISNNPYFKRDFRRQYPRLAVVDQQELSKLLLTQADALGLPAPAAAAASSESSVVTASSLPPSLSSLYSASSSSTPAKISSQSWLPPAPPGKKYNFKKTDGLGTVDPNAHFPMYTVT